LHTCTPVLVISMTPSAFVHSLISRAQLWEWSSRGRCSPWHLSLAPCTAWPSACQIGASLLPTAPRCAISQAAFWSVRLVRSPESSLRVVWHNAMSLDAVPRRCNGCRSWHITCVALSSSLKCRHVFSVTEGWRRATYAAVQVCIGGICSMAVQT